MLRRAFEVMEARPAKWLARSMQQNRALVAAGAGSTWRRADRVVRVAGLVVVGKVVMVMETVGTKKRVKENGSRTLDEVTKRGVETPRSKEQARHGPRKPGLDAETPDPATRRRWIQSPNKPPHALREKGPSREEGRSRIDHEQRKTGIPESHAALAWR